MNSTILDVIDCSVEWEAPCEACGSGEAWLVPVGVDQEREPVTLSDLIDRHCFKDGARQRLRITIEAV